MKIIKFLSTLLALIFIISAFPLASFAEGEDETEDAAATETVDETEDAEDGEDSEGGESSDGKINYMNDGFASRQEKLDTMSVVREQDGYRLWYEDYTGEVAIEQISTGEVLFTNPYDISAKGSKISTTVKKQLLSQIRLTYLDNEKETEMYSFVEAAERDQIHLKNIKNGIRVEYTLGEDAVQRLVPRMISVERFEKFISGPLQEAVDENVPGALFAQTKLMGFFTEKNLAKATTDKAVRDMIATFPIVKQMAVWVCDTSVSAARLKELETYIKTYCPKYTYEELETDNEMTGYVNTDAAPPRFTMALEYTISEDGVQVSLPANGISFDEEAYPLKEISILPYIGAGSSKFTGYTFLPDGSGTIIRYEDIQDNIYKKSGQMYGPDYAYHEIKSGNEQTMRMPVFGLVTQYSNPLAAPEEGVPIYNDSGFLAIITEGDSMATLTSEHGGTLYGYNHVYATFNPRPSDSYNLADSISVSGTDAKWTVTSERRYTGRYTIKLVMLNGVHDGKGYEPSYVGMAEAYRDHLYANGTLERLEASDNLPLFIESFGSIKTTKRVASVPVKVNAPLTTFENVETMADELKAEGIDSVNFKLRGFANGGLVSTMPYKLKWVGELGGNSGFTDLISYANENGVGIYPDFDFAYMYVKDAFDGVNLKNNAVKTIDDRYNRKKEYDPAYQSLMLISDMDNSMSMTAISPASFDYFFSKFTGNYSGYGNKAISMSSLGSDLNSDFNKNNPYHREDSKDITTELLARAKEDYDTVMVAGGNAYAYEYADVISDMALTSSEYIYASGSVPFMGMVLHGAKTIMGEPLNMEGDPDEALLRAIENGATINFTLSYQNTDKLKDSGYWRRYYSVSYEIWKDDVVEYYNTLNDATKDLQDKLIVGHKYVSAKRIPDEDELEADAKELEELQAEAQEKLKAEEEKNAKIARRNERLGKSSTVVPSKIKIPTEIDTSKYEVTGGSVVEVEYEGGVRFLLNFNSFDVTAVFEGTEYTIEAMGFIRIG